MPTVPYPLGEHDALRFEAFAPKRGARRRLAMSLLFILVTLPLQTVLLLDLYDSLARWQGLSFIDILAAVVALLLLYLQIRVLGLCGVVHTPIFSEFISPRALDVSRDFRARRFEMGTFKVHLLRGRRGLWDVAAVSLAGDGQISLKKLTTNEYDRLRQYVSAHAGAASSAPDDPQGPTARA